MRGPLDLARIASLVGDPARAAMVEALMDGRALTATELSRSAGITPQTASSHLSQLSAAGLIEVEKQGRHRYHRLATPSVARMMESIMQLVTDLAPSPARRQLTTGPRDAAMRKARTCYDHFAGRLGVALTDALVEQGRVELTSDAGLLTETGIAFLGDLGLDLEPLLGPGVKKTARVLCRPCLDWSERRPHLAGALGAALCAHSMDHGWTRRITGTRAVEITPKGERVLREKFRVRNWIA